MKEILFNEESSLDETVIEDNTSDHEFSRQTSNF